MSSGDTLTYDMAQSTDKAAPSVFVKKDYLNILDSNSGNYNGNQIILDTSQLSNSNKYMSYREAYLSVPLVMAVSSPTGSTGMLATDLKAASRCFGLKQWFGSIINSMVLDYAGTTIVQQTSLCGLWNTFTLMTSLSQSDIDLNGPTLGFFPDDVNFLFSAANGKSGVGTCNNVLQCGQGSVSKGLGASEFGNSGFWARMAKTVIDPAESTSQLGSTIESIVSATSLKSYYRSVVSYGTANSTDGIVYAIQAQIYLKHIHSFFANCPLMKGVFFRLTLNINQPTVVIKCSGADAMGISSIVSPLGGVVPIMVASQESNFKGSASDTALPTQGGLRLTTADASARISLNVGNKIIDPTQKSLIGSNGGAGLGETTSLNQSCQLYIPAYTFNPSYEEAYLSRPTKTIQYTDIYQFTTPGIRGSFNQLISNGISNIKSILVLPFFKTITKTGNDYPPIQSPFDSAGAGTTSPLASVVKNFQVVVAGQNMFYNTQNFGYEEFLNQFVGVNSINGNLTDGLTSGLVDFQKWNSLYGYQYVNVSRKLPVDESVPMSVSIQGTTQQEEAMPEISFVIFISYGVQVSLDVLTGARV